MELGENGLREEYIEIFVVDFGSLTSRHDSISEGCLQFEERILAHHGRILEKVLSIDIEVVSSTEASVRSHSSLYTVHAVDHFGVRVGDVEDAGGLVTR